MATVSRHQIKGRVALSDPERLSLTPMAEPLSRKALEEGAHIAQPETLLAWQRRLIAEESDGSRNCYLTSLLATGWYSNGSSV
jgi:putative transposase